MRSSDSAQQAGWVPIAPDTRPRSRPLARTSSPPRTSALGSDSLCFASPSGASSPLTQRPGAGDGRAVTSDNGLTEGPHETVLTTALLRHVAGNADLKPPSPASTLRTRRTSSPHTWVARSSAACAPPPRPTSQAASRSSAGCATCSTPRTSTPGGRTPAHGAGAAGRTRPAVALPEGIRPSTPLSDVALLTNAYVTPASAANSRRRRPATHRPAGDTATAQARSCCSSAANAPANSAPSLTPCAARLATSATPATAPSRSPGDSTTPCPPTSTPTPRSLCRKRPADVPQHRPLVMTSYT